MLDTLLAAERDGLIDSEGIEEEVDTFMFAGHDTTGIAITFILFLLAHHPEAQEKILEEIRETKESSGTDDILFNDLNNMKYLERVIKECLRIYSPVPFIARRITEEVEYGIKMLIVNSPTSYKHILILSDGFILPADTIIHFHIYDLHHDPEQFPDPEKFDPDRFLPENIEKQKNFAYIPFSAGPRNCIGQKFALLEIKTLLVTLLPKFEILPVTKKEDLIFIADIVLRTKNPVEVIFKPRN
jgi:cytochrome P450 family 4